MNIDPKSETEQKQHFMRVIKDLEWEKGLTPREAGVMALLSLQSENQRLTEELRIAKFDYGSMFDEVKRLRGIIDGRNQGLIDALELIKSGTSEKGPRVIAAAALEKSNPLNHEQS